MKTNLTYYGDMLIIHVIIIVIKYYAYIALLLLLYQGYSASKMSLYHTFEGLMPPVICLIHLHVCFKYVNITWQIPAAVLFIIGPYFCLSATKLLLCNVTLQRCSIFHDFHLQIVFLSQIALFPIFNNVASAWTKDERQQKEKMLLWFCFISNVIVYFHYISNVIRQLCQYLDIDCFSNEKQRKRAKIKVN